MAEVVWSKISGLAELQRTLEELPVKLAKTGIRNALKAGAAPVTEGMAAEAPKNTGFMSEHFGTRTHMLSGKDIGGTIYIGPEGKIRYPNGQEISVAKAASLVEFGHQTRGPEGQYLHGKKSNDRRQVAPNPFMTRAWERTKAAALKALTDTLRIEVIAAALQKVMGSAK